MADTEIFKNQRDFNLRKNKKINGVSSGFAKEYPKYKEMNETNEGCWECIKCKFCNKCNYCHSCEFCEECYFCEDCRHCDQCHQCDQCANKKSACRIYGKGMQIQ